jgi:hypothetical protein
MRGKQLNVSAIHEWGMLKYSQWQDNSTIVPTAEEIWSKVDASFVQVADNQHVLAISADAESQSQGACMSPDAPDGQCPFNPLRSV